MNIVFKNGKYDNREIQDSSRLYTEVNENMFKIESSSRTSPLDTVNYPIGYIIPLGTLGNSPNKAAEFKSNFHIIAYTLADELMTESKLAEDDFVALNINELTSEQGQIAKMVKKIDSLAEEALGKGWHVTIFNVKTALAIDSMCKGNTDIDSMKKAIDDFTNIVNNRVDLLKHTSTKSPWKHELVELFYTPLNAISSSFTKIVDRNSVNDEYPLGQCNNIVIETLVYDSYANGLRLLTNTESFASTKIRQHSDETDNIYLYVLKARINKEDMGFRPVRQFGGKSKVVSTGEVSGCTERIIYNLVNNNYKQWSFISIPSTLRMELKDKG